MWGPVIDDWGTARREESAEVCDMHAQFMEDWEKAKKKSRKKTKKSKLKKRIKELEEENRRLRTDLSYSIYMYRQLEHEKEMRTTKNTWGPFKITCDANR